MQRHSGSILRHVDPEENARQYFELFDPSSATNRRLDKRIEAERKRSYRECRRNNPSLMRKLRRMSDYELLAVIAEILETSPNQNRLDVVALRRVFVFFHLSREALKPRPVRRYRARLPSVVAPTLAVEPVAVVPTNLATVANPFPKPEPEKKPETPKPDLDSCYPKAFGINGNNYDVW
jgi:hypothetical protein